VKAIILGSKKDIIIFLLKIKDLVKRWKISKVTNLNLMKEEKISQEYLIKLTIKD